MTTQPSSTQQAKQLDQLLAAGRLNDAMRLAQALIIQDACNGYAWHRLGLACLMQGQDSAAVAALANATRLPGAGAEAFDHYGVALIRSGQHQLARSAIEYCLTLSPARASAWSNLAEIELVSGNLKEAEVCAKRSLALDAHDVSALITLGNVRWATGRGNEAATSFRQVLALQPDHCTALANLGALLQAAWQPAAALPYFARLTQLQPHSATAHLQLAGALLANAQPAAAATIAHHSVQLQASASGHHVLGTALKQLGELMAANLQFRAAVEILLATPELRPIPTRPFSPIQGHAVLKRARQCLESAGLRFGLFAGTLLGIVRGGDLLTHDKDLDLALPWDTPRQQVSTALCAGGDFLPYPLFQPGDSQTVWHQCFVHAGSGQMLDLFYLKPKGDKFLAGFDHLPEPILCQLPRFDFGQINWRGESWPAPAPTETYLQAVYGSQWRIPDPDFDTLLSNPSRLPQSLPVAICHAHGRLYQYILQGFWAKAAALVGQIRRHQDAYYLGQWQAQLITRLKQEGRE
ncbi:tetratricopeptide repeat protein [Parachitinimonas caeni]|uniref:Tetratricopeptide repeat protein n=1 Tax=Parachitinimonas caeni TaxID=3031301 RepID=A0ABT7DZR4_9NEIS|nr:tetratricopeptide repeat protein [Parachitinimonas caeni]MDK2125551.1 hypothetical protein [Parachitinimonas caeni]